MILLFVWSAAALAASIYCIARAIVDLRQRKYIWAALGFVSAAIFILSPIPTHAVKIDLPIQTTN